MFRRLTEAGPSVALTVDGKAVAARNGDTVAAALLALVLGVGIVGPAIILALALRWN